MIEKQTLKEVHIAKPHYISPFARFYSLLEQVNSNYIFVRLSLFYGSQRCGGKKNSAPNKIQHADCRI